MTPEAMHPNPSKEHEMSTWPTDEEREAAEGALQPWHHPYVPNSAATNTALEAMAPFVVAREQAVAVQAIRDAAAELDSFEGPGGRTSAHDAAGRDIIRLLRDRADRIERGQS